MKTMRLWMCVVCGLLFASGLYARKTGVLDEIVFGHSASEKKHGFSAKASQVVTGGLGEEARVLLPISGERVEGGHITFTISRSGETELFYGPFLGLGQREQQYPHLVLRGETDRIPSFGRL